MPRYLTWLQAGNPVGEVERYPEIDDHGQTSLPGVYVAGDLTGIPLLKLAAESGAQRIRHFAADPAFAKERRAQSDPDVLEVLILGAGPAGVSAALECKRQGLRHAVLESAQPFQTLENFPAGKPIYAKPDHYREEASLRIEDGTKESLLSALKARLAGEDLDIRSGRALRILRRNSRLEVETAAGENLKALRVVLAIGKSGDARRLRVPGEELPHVFNRLFDPGEFRDRELLVVGGGDSAVEAAVALAEAGNRVGLSYRQQSLDRPKPGNVAAFEAAAAAGRIVPLLGTEVKEIKPGKTLLNGDIPGGANAEKEVPADAVFVLIGRDPPLAFLRRSGIRIAGERRRRDLVFLAAMLGLFTMLYCGKAGVARDVFAGTEGWLAHISAYLAAPFRAALPWTASDWTASLAFVLGWAGSLVFLAAGPLCLGFTFAERRRYWGSPWSAAKHAYFAGIALLFLWAHFHYLMTRNAGWVEGPVYWYSLAFTVTMVLFGLRRIAVRKTRYIRWQILTLALVQGFFLFLLPFHLFDAIIKPSLDPQGWVLRELFPAGKWSSFGFVLFWPLNMGDFGKSAFWTVFPFFQTFLLLPWLIFRWGKGAYCGWICSCGGLAETLGDEYRQRAPHGKTPKRLEHIGQGVLAFAVLVTALAFLTRALPLGPAAEALRGAYKLSIDVGFAGVAGLGLYFLWGGRVWCRYGCPLAALMHIYNRFSVYRILAEKKKCISCNVCTKVCHMGIDVMNYANKGIPMNDVQCVRCSACVQSCPTETLSFGSVPMDTGNRARVEVPDYGKEDWRAGLR